MTYERLELRIPWNRLKREKKESSGNLLFNDQMKEKEPLETKKRWPEKKE